MLDSTNAGGIDPPVPPAKASRARSTDGVAKRLDSHEKRLSRLESMSMQMIGELKGLRSDLQELGRDMRDVIRTMADTAARQPLDYMPRDQVREAFQLEREAREELAKTEKEARDQLAGRVKGLEDKQDRRDEAHANRGHNLLIGLLTAGAAVAAAVLGAAFSGVFQRALGH